MHLLNSFPCSNLHATLQSSEIITDKIDVEVVRLYQVVSMKCTKLAKQLLMKPFNNLQFMLFYNPRAFTTILKVQQGWQQRHTRQTGPASTNSLHPHSRYKAFIYYEHLELTFESVWSLKLVLSDLYWAV